MKSCAICLAFCFQMDIQCGGVSVENFVHVCFRGHQRSKRGGGVFWREGIAAIFLLMIAEPIRSSSKYQPSIVFNNSIFVFYEQYICFKNDLDLGCFQFFSNISSRARSRAPEAPPQRTIVPVSSPRPTHRHPSATSSPLLTGAILECCALPASFLFFHDYAPCGMRSSSFTYAPCCRFRVKVATL